MCLTKTYSTKCTRHCTRRHSYTWWGHDVWHRTRMQTKMGKWCQRAYFRYHQEMHAWAYEHENPSKCIKRCPNLSMHYPRAYSKKTRTPARELHMRPIKFRHDIVVCSIPDLQKRALILTSSRVYFSFFNQKSHSSSIKGALKSVWSTNGTETQEHVYMSCRLKL